MTTTTHEFIPYDKVFCNMLEILNNEEFPFFGGTGFFAVFPPFDYIFYVTAKHCFSNMDEIFIKEHLLIPYTTDIESEFYTHAVKFSHVLFTKENINDEEYEDIVVFVVDNDIKKEKKDMLIKRAFRLQHQDDINAVINMLIEKNENIRTVGFPQVSKQIDYEKKQLYAQPRGYYGKIKNTSKLGNRYGFENPSWKEKEYGGFSGSPIIALIPTSLLNIEAIVIGVLLTATSSRGEFISINVTTNLIAQFIVSVR